ncbi:MAG: hypothetical protein BMS9Abin05_0154 [Rhodothermia bacterium]|nr:MAG: hypothetical protein BMS9Abin05_0154 [Rhodothermia bacterium]
MLQAFKNNLYKKIVAQFPEQEFYTSAHLSGTQMPVDVGHFVSQALSRRTTLEARDLITCSSPWIDFDSESTRKTVDDFVAQLGQQGRFPRFELEKALDRAVGFCSQYVLQPVATVTAFAVSDRERENSFSDVRRRAGYFLYHGSVLESLENLLNRADENQITRADVESQLRKDATEKAKDLDADGWLRLMDPILKTYRIAYPETADIPVQMIQAFLEERGASGLSEALASTAEATEGLLSADDLASEIRTFLEPAVAASELSAQVPPESNVLPLWKQFTKVEQPGSDDPSDGQKRERPHEPLWKTYQQESSTSGVVTQNEMRNEAKSKPSRPGEDSVLGDAIQYRDRFIGELFGSDPAAFEQTMDRLSSIRSWDEASQILTLEVFRKYRIDIYGETAVLFTNAIEQQVKQHS